MRIRLSRLSSLLLTSVVSWIVIPGQMVAEAAPTTTTLLVTSAGVRTVSVVSGSVITLTAKVKSGREVVTVGQVNFCEAAAKTCTDIHLLGTAQLTSTGSAVMRFVPGIGKHSYKAIFAGTPHGANEYAASVSRNAPLSVTGKFLTATSLSSSGSEGDYTLTATVAGLVNTPSLPAPAGKVSFVDTTEANHVLGIATLGAGTLGLGFFNSNTPGTNPYPQSVAVADFNGDGKLDLAVPVYSIFTSYPDVNILLGLGDGTFKAGPTFPVSGQNVNNAAVADFNGDGKPDLAISLPDAEQVQVLLGNGDGTFTAMPALSVNLVSVVATGDFNGDGNADLVVVCFGAQALTILLGNGDGTFTQGATVSDTNGPVAVAVGDFNGDGIPDLAAADSNGGESEPSFVTIFLGNGDGTFTQASTPQAGVEPLSVAAGDFNGDGILDLAVTNLNDGYPIPGSVTILLGDGKGNFESTATLQTGSIPYTVSIADVNGDGMADLVTANAGSNSFDVFLGNGNGTFAAPLSPPAGTNPVGAGVGDFNGDGLPDLAAANNTTNSVTVLLTQETQTATATATGIAPKGSGKHSVDAKYKGDSTYLGSTSAPVSLAGSDEPSH